ncbi:MAG: YbaB/EbfC family nucleoid-associated protein [Actinobacteria bacterium]|nr:YbaB/EbfC family nucleoid-associated protein [Actinomycetota bacterium]
MMKQLQQVQKQLAEAQDSLAEETVEHTAGGGVVKVIVDGQQKIREIKIDPQVVDPEDVGMLEDLVLVAINGALEEAEKFAAERMEGITGGFNIPGL